MHRNPGTKTIEECLLKALKDAKLITEDGYNRPQTMFFQRAARTDKSVSAIKQVVSLKVYDSITSQLEEVNNMLPADIRLMACKRVVQSFDAKNYCDARTYSYLMPTFALCPMNELTKEDYRITEDVLKIFNETLKGFVGSHVFHNYTSGKSYKEDSSVRLIRFMYCSEPFFPCDQKEMEFVVVRVKGQSFMMHQIRKMIGMAIAVVRGFATEDHLKRSMEEPYMDIPKAPGLGLMLEETHFDRYNKKFGGDGHHEPLEWNEFNDKIEEFKNKFIYPVVVDSEKKEKSMFNWLDTLQLHSYGADSTYRNRYQVSFGLIDDNTKADETKEASQEVEEVREEPSIQKKVKLS